MRVENPDLFQLASMFNFGGDLLRELGMLDSYGAFSWVHIVELLFHLFIQHLFIAKKFLLLLFNSIFFFVDLEHFDIERVNLCHEDLISLIA